MFSNDIMHTMSEDDKCDPEEYEKQVFNVAAVAQGTH